MAMSFRGALQSLLKAGVKAGAEEAERRLSPPAHRSPTDHAGPRPPAGPRRPPRETSGALRFDYAPRRDGRADPGEVVWAWVPFEENDGRGKDRPVLVVSRDGDDLLALMLTSKDHDRDRADGRHWLDVGTGDWDSQGRPSEVRLDRVLRLGQDDVRREGSALDRARFDEVAAAVSRLNG